MRGGGGEYEGVYEGEMEGLHSLLHTVGFFVYFPFQVLSVLFTKPTASTRERERKRETGRQGGIEREAEAERVRARACARLSEHLVSVPTATLPARKGGVEREFIGPLLSADSCALSLTHTNTAHTRTDDTRGSGSRLCPQGHRPRTQTHRRRSRAACEWMRQLPVSQKTNAVSVPSSYNSADSSERNVCTT